MTFFRAAAHGTGGFTVAGESLGGDISIVASSGTATYRESFTESDSAIRDAAALQSYCESILAQWAYNRKHGIANGRPWRDAR